MQTHTQTPSPHRMRSPDPTLEWETTDETRFGPEATDETPCAPYGAPYETTVAPDETTIAPDQTTVAPDDETTVAPEDDETTVAPDEAPSEECTNLGELVLSVCPGCCGGETLGECAKGCCEGETLGDTKLYDGYNITCSDAATWEGGSMCNESIQCA